jgi:hypothetical protein
MATSANNTSPTAAAAHLSKFVERTPALDAAMGSALTSMESVEMNPSHARTIRSNYFGDENYTVEWVEGDGYGCRVDGHGCETEQILERAVKRLPHDIGRENPNLVIFRQRLMELIDEIHRESLFLPPSSV